MKWALYNCSTTTSFGGIETTVWSLGQELVKNGHQVTIYGGLSNKALNTWMNEIKILVFPYCQRKKFSKLGTRASKFLERLSFAYWAIPELLRSGCERMVVFKSFDVWAALLVKHKIGIKVGFLSGSSEFYPGLGWLVRRLDYIASVSIFNSIQYANNIGIKPKINYPGVDTRLFYPSIPDKSIIEKYNLNKNDEIIVTAVRLVALKGIHRVIKAIAILIPFRPRLKFLIAGDGIYRSVLECLVTELGLNKHIYFLGFLDQSQLANFYALGTLALFPSIGEEILGLSIAEAMACGVPVIASQLGGIPEVISQAGILVPTDCDDKDLAQAINMLLDNKSQRDFFSKIGRDRILKLFNWSACAKRLEEGMT